MNATREQRRRHDTIGLKVKTVKYQFQNTKYKIPFVVRRVGAEELEASHGRVTIFGRHNNLSGTEKQVEKGGESSRRSLLA